MVIKEKNQNKKKINLLLEDLSRLESYIKDLFSFLPFPVCMVSPIGIILEANAAFEKISGYKIEEIIGKPIEDVLDKNEVAALFEKTLQKSLVEVEETTLFTKEKTEIPVSISTRLRKSEKGEIMGYFVGFFNLTEVKKIQNQLQIKIEELEKLGEKIKERTKELEESRVALMNILDDVEEARGKTEEEKNRTLSIIANLSDGLLVFDKENNLSLINSKAENFFEIKATEIIGKPLSELSQYPYLAALNNLLEEEAEGIFRRELFLQENLILEVSTVPIIVKEERINFLIVLHDVTREKTIERMKSEFVSISAHQLRTPLSAIKWTLRMILDGDIGEITEEQRELLGKTYASNERMINLINDLLDITRIEEGRHLYKSILTDIEPVIQFVINSCREEIERKKLGVEFKRPEKKLPKIMIDVEKIRLAFQNLLDNAIRYTPLGGKVTVSLKHVKKEIEIVVKDTGIGIPQNQQERVFTKFFRGANVLRMTAEGTGLGLFIAKNIIEAHGGRIWFESEENKGTTFCFTLPVKEVFEEFLKEF